MSEVKIRHNNPLTWFDETEKDLVDAIIAAQKKVRKATEQLRKETEILDELYAKEKIYKQWKKNGI